MVNLVKTFGSLAKLFSPSLEAAKDLAQKKGSYEQLKAMMIKNGAKADELEWSGADNFFEGKKVTKDEIVEYLSQNDPRLYTERRVATEGLTGASDQMSAEDAVAKAMEDTTMVEQAKLDFLSDMKSEPDNNAEFIASLEKNNRLDAFLENEVREGLEDQFNMDQPAFLALHRIEAPSGFGEGDTQYSSYFPEGAERYMENLYQYTDPTEKIPFNQFASSRHFGEDDIGTIFHTRTGDFPVDSASETGGMGSLARYVGEIQSDPQQALRGEKPRGYKETALVSEISKLTDKAFNSNKKLLENNKKMFANNLSEEELGRLGREAAIFQINKIIKDPTKQNDTFKDMAKAFKIKDELPLDTSSFTEDELEFLHYQLYNFDEFRGVNLFAKDDKRKADELLSARMQAAWTRDPLGVEAVQEYMSSNPVDWLNEGFRRYYGNLNADNMLLKMDILDNRKAIEKIELNNFSGEQGFKEAGAPFMSSQGKWVDQIIGKSILDAVNDPSINYLTFPDDIGAIAKVTGKNVEDLEPGTEKFYKTDTQNRLKKFLKKFDVNPPIGQVFLDPPPIAGQNTSESFSSKGFKITPEFREAVIKKGIPTFALPPIIGYGALNSMGENENGDQM